MRGPGKWPRILVIVGLVAMLIGAVDPLEGCVIVLPATGMVALGALLGRSRHRRLLSQSFVLVSIGVGALWGLSALGGIGSSSGRSKWWGLVLLPYPVGWITGLVGAIRTLREAPRASVPPGA